MVSRPLTRPITSGASQAVNSRRRVSNDNYILPSQFISIFNPNFTISRTEAGTYTHTYSAASQQPLGTVKYVDPVSGSDANNGNSSGTAYQTLQQAYDQGADVIMLAAGFYDENTGFDADWASDRGISVIGPSSGLAIVSRALNSPAFTLDSGNVYVASSVTDIATVVDQTRTQSTAQETLVDGTTGVPIPFTEVASKAACEALEYSYYDDGADLYVHAASGAAPNLTNMKVLPNVDLMKHSTPMDGNVLYLKDVEFWGEKAVSIDVSASGQNSYLIAENVAARYAIGNNWSMIDVNTRLLNCQATDSKEDDGFDYSRNTAYTYSVNGLEVDCYAARNGYDGAGSNDNGSTTHNRFILIRLNTVCRENYGPNFADTAGSFTVNLGCQSIDTNDSTGQGFAVGGASASYEGVCWFEDCTASSGDARGFNRSTGGHLVQLANNSGQTNGTIIDGADLSNVSAIFGPVNTVAPSVSGPELVGSELSCTTGTWTGLPVITYAYQWQRDGVDIAGATASTYTLVSADAGAAMGCQVTALVGPAYDPDAFASAAANSNTTGAIVEYDTDAAAYFTTIEAASMTISSANKVKIDTMVKGIKADGDWDTISVLDIWALVDDVDSAGKVDTLVQTQIKGSTTQTLTNIVFGDYDATDGFTFDGSSKKIQVGWDYGAIDALYFGVGWTPITLQSGSEIFSNYIGLDSISIYYQGTSGQLRGFIHTGTQFSPITASNVVSVGTEAHIGMAADVDGDDTATIWIDGSKVTTTGTAGPLGAQPRDPTAGIEIGANSGDYTDGDNRYYVGLLTPTTAEIGRIHSRIATALA